MSQEHRIRWYGISGDERIPRNRHMRGRDWGWDAECSCGWKSRTGGAIQQYVRKAVADHRWNVENLTDDQRRLLEER